MKRIVTHLSLLAAAAVFATGCVPVRHNLPPEQRLMEPGPGVGGPGPGVLGPPAMNPNAGMIQAGTVSGPISYTDSGDGQGETIVGGSGAPGVIPAGFRSCGPDCNRCGGTGRCSLGSKLGLGAGGGQGGIPQGGGVLTAAIGTPGVPTTVQVTFGSPDGMQVRYDSSGGGGFDSEPLIVPARQNFPQGGLYRIKLTNIQGREGVELYPTVELAYGNPRTGAYLAHNSIPIQFTEEDFDQVATGNFVTKVLYLPDPEFQGPALAGIDTLVSTRLDPGIDPIVEADRRGSILAIIRLGDKDIEMPGTSNTVGSSGVTLMPPIAGLPAPFAPAMTKGCGGLGSGNGSDSCNGGGACGGSCPCGSGSAGLRGLCNNGSGMQCASTPPQLPGMISGVTAPQYGMPITGTPIGLPGPPHIPLGTPAGLKKHVMRNHTPLHLPRPVDKMKINVRQRPGYSYPNPVSRVNITEHNIHPGVPHHRGHYQHPSQEVDPNCQP
jgi:hypothetical protein